MLISSKATRNYIKATSQYYTLYKQTFIDAIGDSPPPYKIGFKFIRGTRHRFDYVNPLQTVQDLMVKYDWLEDDSSDHLLPVFDTYEYNKDKPGVLITIKGKENVKNKKTNSRDTLHKTVKVSKNTQNNNKSSSNKRPRKH